MRKPWPKDAGKMIGNQLIGGADPNNRHRAAPQVERGGLRLPQNYCGFGIRVLLRGLHGNARHNQCESDEGNRHDVIAAPPLLHRKGHTRSCDQQRRKDDHGCRFTCAPSTSRRRADEKAIHLPPDALNGAAANAQLAGNFQDAFAEA